MTIKIRGREEKSQRNWKLVDGKWWVNSADDIHSCQKSGCDNYWYYCSPVRVLATSIANLMVMAKINLLVTFTAEKVVSNEVG